MVHVAGESAAIDSNQSNPYHDVIDCRRRDLAHDHGARADLPSGLSRLIDSTA